MSDTCRCEEVKPHLPDFALKLNEFFAAAGGAFLAETFAPWLRQLAGAADAAALQAMVKAPPRWEFTAAHLRHAFDSPAEHLRFTLGFALCVTCRSPLGQLGFACD